MIMNSLSIQELFKCRHLKSVKVDDHEILKKYPFLEFEWKFQYVAVKTLVKNLLFTCNKLYDDDQIKLLKNCWYELLLVIMCRRTIEHETDENGLMFFCGVLSNKDVGLDTLQQLFFPKYFWSQLFQTYFQRNIAKTWPPDSLQQF